MKKLSVIIPSRNEAENLLICVDKIAKALISAKILYEIIVVDDGSTDNTTEVINNLIQKIQWLGVYAMEKKMALEEPSD